MIDNIKNIFLPLNSEVPIHVVMPTALTVAKKFQARLTTILLESTSEQLIAFAGEGLATGTITEMMDEALCQTKTRLKDIYTEFDLLQKHGKHQWYHLRAQNKATLSIPHPSISELPQTSFEILDNSNNNALTARFRLSDMSIVPPIKDYKSPQASDILHNILFDSGRPLLIAPPTPQEQIGNKIAVAWNGSSEASNALRYALPWLKKAEKVTIFHTSHYHAIGPHASLAAEFLSLHDITADIQEFTAEKRSIGEELLKAVNNSQADMLVMGAYSHSRLRQMILGGVTRHVLEHATLPILMAR